MRMRLDIHAPPGSPRRRYPPGRCTVATCRHHLAGEPEPCSLVLARERPRTLAEVGEVLGGICRERVRQIEADALRNFKAAAERLGLTPDMLPDPSMPSRWDMAGVQWKRGELTPPEWQRAQNARYRRRVASKGA